VVVVILWAMQGKCLSVVGVSFARDGCFREREKGFSGLGDLFGLERLIELSPQLPYDLY
jgi:hypothetical protein